MTSTPDPFRWRAAVAAAAVAILAVSCASDPTASDEYVTLAAERDDLAAAAEDLRAEVSDLEAEVDGLTADVADVEAERDAAIAESDELRVRYDPQIRAEAQAAWDAELGRACAEAKADVDASVADLVQHDGETMGLIGTEADLVAAVEGCAAEERAKSAEQREADRLAACAPADTDQIQKDPASYDGTCVVLFARIVQFDAATGRCSFQANVSNSPHEYGFEYGPRAQFGYGDVPSLQGLEDDCPQLDAVDADDHVKVWATGIGAFSYDTSIGGSNTVPAFRIEKVDVVRKE